MVYFLLSRRTDFYFWTGLLTGIAVIGNFGVGYMAVAYASTLFPMFTFLLLIVSGTLAFFYFWSQKRSDSKLGSGCFGGITTSILLFNLGYSLLTAVALLQLYTR